MSGLNDWNKRWYEQKKDTIGQKIMNTIRPPPPLKNQITSAIYKIAMQISKLDYNLSKLEAYDKQLFEKTVNSIVEGDKSKAGMYANEVAEVRKMAKVLLTVRFALERVKLRLDTTLIFGDVNADLAPAIVALKNVAGYLKGMMPDVFTELIGVDEELQMAMMQYSSGNVPILENEYVTEEARKILKDASLVAEQRMKQEFPEIPSIEGIPSSSTTSTTASEVGK
ncbi:MAG: Snf7 family protein [Caldisphaeraceae archaeon]|nr:Snf7 family protein [Caldisphaeraceae archaeon]MEB2793499.1 Snf7 family protein [Caldisphaeraceae archaeon]MEB3692613.1 Snf7 family protein [Caldisphaeraceae archaeon]MEB3798543.1 Snf7 family protein [Caldisphaeraceae archaeon]